MNLCASRRVGFRSMVPPAKGALRFADLIQSLAVAHPEASTDSCGHLADSLPAPMLAMSPVGLEDQHYKQHLLIGSNSGALSPIDTDACRYAGLADAISFHLAAPERLSR